MPKRQVFYSFHYKNDVMRAQQIRNIGALEGNTPVSPNEWEQVKKLGDNAIKRWIDATMASRSCVIVLIGAETASREFIQYEIKHGWSSQKGVFGIYIHNLKDPQSGTSNKGKNPFDGTRFTKNGVAVKIETYDPPSDDAYNYIARNIESWIERAIAQAK
jgi:hypothetical protein